jgi:SAM-dependent methyltransferase
MSTHDAHTCRLCRQPTSRPALTLVGMPRWNHRLLQEHELERDAPIDLVVHRCESCGFVSLAGLLEDDYYAEYVNAPSMSPKMQAFLQEQAQDFVDRFELRGLAILEVGCGDGGFLAKLRDAGAACVGIEPSRAQREMALSQGLRVHGGLLDTDRLLEGAPFDAFATRQVFEHVDDMHGFLAAVRAHLKPSGVGLVEVPNLDILLAQDRFFDFIPEHLNYFSPRTLRLVLELAGFEVLSVDPVQDGEALRALVRRVAPPTLDGPGARVEQLRAEIAAFVGRRRALGERVAVWGAGGKGLSMLAATALREVDLLVDGDPHKHGRYTPVSHLCVLPPEALREHGIGAVVIMAPAYRDEILRQLRTRYGFEGAVGIVGPTFELIEPLPAVNFDSGV